MPKLYEYLGITVFFYSNDHEPIHVHGRYGELESKIEISIKDGLVKAIKIQKVAGKRSLPASQAKHFLKLVDTYADDIVHSWINYFVFHKKIVPKKLAGKL